jgi:hypothetical protein
MGKMLTVARMVAWVGAVIVWWSLNVVWGSDADAGKGPPGQWQRYVVGAGLLALVGAIALSASGRGGKPPSPLARGIALACALAIGLIAYLLRRDALVDFPHLLAGPGWTWLLAGGGFLLAATTLTFGLPPPVEPERKSGGPRNKRKRRKRKR